ncbi:MAG: DUF853 family protein [Paludibacteraceae bacterium]|nr:DUF853 family protein [Paludibacteraceae bacterium]
MLKDNKILMGRGEDFVYLLPKMANRHGLIAGATGTGKTITLEVMAEAFSSLGVPVFLADVKGDISGICRPGAMNESLEKRLTKMQIPTDEFTFRGFPCRFFDVYGEGGHPVRTTVSEMGPVLLARLLGLTEVQEGVLNIVFRIADDRGLLLIDLKDLKAMLQYVGQNTKQYITQYGNMTQQSLGAIQRALLQLEDEGGALFFGEPDLKISDWMMRNADGMGYINILHCVKLFQHPLLYSTFLLWLLSELFEELPEQGDMDRPKMVFFFDEAHLLFNDAPKALVQKVEQVVKLIRSKGVGVYFVTQNPSDLPDSVLAQLGNRVQHALRAYTPAEMKAVRTAAQSFRTNPKFKTEDVITDLGTGEALVSFLDEDGKPGIVERAKIICPQSSMSAIDNERRRAEIMSSDLYGKYEQTVDRQSAYEDLQRQQQADAEQAKHDAEQKAKEDELKKREKELEKREKAAQRTATRTSTTTTRRTTTRRKSSLEKMADTTMTTIGRELGKSILRSITGIFKK